MVRIATTAYSYIELNADMAEELEGYLTEVKDLNLVEKASALSPTQTSFGQSTPSSPGGGSASEEFIAFNVPFDEKNAAKDMGGKWDSARKSWTIPANRAAEAAAKWPRK
jgi:hypothetical protein